MFCHGIAGKGTDHFFLLVNDHVQFEGQSCQSTRIHDLLIKEVSIEEVYLAVPMTNPVVVMIGDRPVRANPWQQDLASPSEPRNGMGHALSDADDEIG